MAMDPKERALTVRLLEKAARHPEYAKKLGLVIAPRPSEKEPQTR